MNELDSLEDGFLLQCRILTELCKLRSLPDKDAPNPKAGFEALLKLKELARDNKLLVEEEKKLSVNRRLFTEEKIKLIQDRANKLQDLRKKFLQGFSNADRQATGYLLEEILEALFPLFELEYRKSYKTLTQQIDGYFNFEGFGYLVEAKWHAQQPTEQEIAGFKRKVDTKLESTRGIFISINGFRQEVIKQFEGEKSNILFITGEDLIFIFEGHINLREMLHIKIEKAAQEGCVLVPVSTILNR